MKTIDKKQAAAIAGMSPKTLERYLRDPEFQLVTGAIKNKISGRVSFDESKFRAYFADVTGNDDLRTGDDPGTVDGEFMEIMDRSLERLGYNVQPEPVAGPDPARIIADAFLLPHKIYLTLDEAKALTGFPKTALKRLSVLKHGRRVIARSKLDKI